VASSLLILLDDIATVLDDVAVMSKIAAKKTAGVLGDDLALNAQQVTGIRAERELPVVWAVAKGSFRNKLILVPSALAISAVASWAITPLLMAGGAFLCFEGAEKILHPLLHREEEAAHHAELTQAVADPAVDMVAFERDKIQGAVRTDFILSAEIVVITLGTVALAPLTQQVLVVGGVALAMTVGVYGLVAAIVKMDDAGLHLSEKPQAAARAVGRALLATAPRMMKALSVVGTAAMFLVGGSILLHGAPGMHEWVHGVEHHVAAWPAVGGVLSWLVQPLVDGAGGFLAGAVLAGVVAGASAIWQRLRR
jgi:predicted DNA repair protein MutK